jgi:hypothetical protein
MNCPEEMESCRASESCMDELNMAISSDSPPTEGSEEIMAIVDCVDRSENEGGGHGTMPHGETTDLHCDHRCHCGDPLRQGDFMGCCSSGETCDEICAHSTSFREDQGPCQCNSRCFDCDNLPAACQAPQLGFDPSVCCGCHDGNCPEQCHSIAWDESDDCYGVTACDEICPSPLDQLRNVTAEDIDAFRQVSACVSQLPTESCIAPLAADTWEQGECAGELITQATPKIDIRQVNCVPRNGFYGCQPAGWTCYGQEYPTWRCDETEFNVTDSTGHWFWYHTCLNGCYPPSWVPITNCDHRYGSMIPPDWVCGQDSWQMEPPETQLSVPGGTTTMTARQFYDEVMHGDYDPYWQPNAEHLSGLSADQCLDFCNNVDAACCRTEDGEYEEKDGAREYSEAPFGCYAYRHDSMQYPYQDPRRDEWHRVTNTKVEEEPNPDVVTPEMAEQMTCNALCDNTMACGGWDLDPYEQINCARYDLRPGLTAAERCLARPEDRDMQARVCEWKEDNQLCEPLRECGTQCKMWSVLVSSFYPCSLTPPSRSDPHRGLFCGAGAMNARTC